MTNHVDGEQVIFNFKFFFGLNDSSSVDFIKCQNEFCKYTPIIYRIQFLRELIKNKDLSETKCRIESIGNIINIFIFGVVIVIIKDVNNDQVINCNIDDLISIYSEYLYFEVNSEKSVTDELIKLIYNRFYKK